MKLKVRGMFLIACCLIIGIMLVVDHMVRSSKINNDLITDSDNFQNAAGNGGHLHVLRKDLDESNYKSDSLKSENLKSGNKENSEDKEIDNNEVNDEFEEDVIKTIREAIHHSSVFKKKESLMKLVDDIQARANDEHFGETQAKPPTEYEQPFRVGWFGRPGNNTDILDLQPIHVEYLTKIKPYKRRFRVVKPNTSHLYEKGRNLSSIQRFHKNINQYRIYDGQDPNIDRLLDDLHSQPIAALKLHEGGTQIKLVLTLNDGSKAMFKPMRFPRERETLPNHFYWSDFERHTAEIASFHLDRVLGFYRVPPTVGRVMNITTDIRKFADDDFESTFFHSPAGNLCFYGSCDYYCDSSHAVCGHPDVIEGSLMAYLPSISQLARKTWRNPWKRTYSKHKKADWEKNPKYCDKIRKKAPYNRGRRLLDLMDLSVFDFLLGNLDRHHYETFTDFGNFTSPMHLDNGRAFGRPRFDDLSILAPVAQCCLIRHSTFTKLLHFNSGPLTLSEALRASLNKDPIAPILLEKHFAALDRRVKIILKTLYDCMKLSPMPFRSVIDDGF